MESVIEVLPLFAFVGGAIVERFSSARSYPTIPGWQLRGWQFLLLGGGFSLVVSLLLQTLLSSIHVLDLSFLGLWGVPLGVLALTFVTYWMHRAFHRFDALWLWVHQLHHSPERLDVWVSVFAHPFELLLQGMLLVLVPRVLLGLTPLASAIVATIALCMNLAQHVNVQTPKAMVLFCQRPEAHNIHHARGVHAHNYSDLPLWDWLFGTYKAPDASTPTLGFYDFASVRVNEMLLGTDVSVEPSKSV